MILWLIYFFLAPYFMIQSFFNPNQYFIWENYTMGIVVNTILYLTYAFIIYFYWRKRGDNKWWISLFYPITHFANFVVIVVAIFYGLRGRKVSWKGRYYSTQGTETLKQKDKKKLTKEKNIDIDNICIIIVNMLVINIFFIKLKKSNKKQVKIL